MPIDEIGERVGSFDMLPGGHWVLERLEARFLSSTIDNIGSGFSREHVLDVKFCWYIDRPEAQFFSKAVFSDLE